MSQLAVPASIWHTVARRLRSNCSQMEVRFSLLVLQGLERVCMASRPGRG